MVHRELSISSRGAKHFNQPPMPHVELMKPRYLVIADYPNSPYEVGNILTPCLNTYEGHVWKFVDNKWSDMIKKKDCDKHPHLFKRLSWYERRGVSGMPEYIKYGVDVYKVNWEDYLGMHPTPVEDLGEISFRVLWHFHKDEFTPATLEDYENYTKTKE